MHPIVATITRAWSAVVGRFSPAAMSDPDAPLQHARVVPAPKKLTAAQQYQRRYYRRRRDRLVASRKYYQEHKERWRTVYAENRRKATKKRKSAK